eukprot:5153370-Pleurochrysis_carterae.AAC.1
MGVVDKVVWIRLKSKHSHNICDRVNSMLKERIWPKGGGLYGGCMSPWDMERIVQEALETQTGDTELAWHMTNFDWVAWFNSFGCCSKDFADTSAERVWVYDYIEDLESHGYVR